MTKARALLPISFPSPFVIILIILWCCLPVFWQGCGRGSRPDELVIMIEKRVYFDPRNESDSAAERMRQLMFNGLTRKDEKFEPVSDLAERFEASPDYRVFTFYLRPGVKFHNGQPLTARDVQYTFETMLDKNFQSKKKVEFVNSLAAVEVKDDRTVVFRCHEPFPGFPNAIIPIGIIPVGTSELQAQRPVGTGPFKFESYTEDQEVVLSSYADYFGGAPAIKHLRVKIIPDNSTREGELLKGSVDLAINADFDPVTVEGLKQAAGLQVEVVDGTNLTHMGINLQDPILKDQRVRQALALAIDREALIRDVLRGQARIAYSALPPSQWAYEPEVEKYPYDPNRAKQLLDQAGRPEKDGQPRLTLSLKTSTVSISRTIAVAMQSQLRKVGIALDLQSLERNKFTQDLSDGNFQLYLNITVGGNQSPDFFKFAYSSKSFPPNGQNRSRYDNPKVDQLLVEAQTADRERQKQIFSQIQKTLAVELPQIYLWYPSTIVVHRARVGGLKIEPSGDWQVLRSMTLASR
ncbi:MAG TPA: ABC transporter substrate-binding protein [Blastocatellia bacterium]|nr:ABC transporter substrate-binding protein [Blastocatellia bacterium]